MIKQLSSHHNTRRYGRGIGRTLLLTVLLGITPARVDVVTAGEIVLSPYSATTVRPERAYEFFNPAFAHLDERPPLDFGPRVPMGILGLLVFPERNPLLYFTDRKRFEERFDLLSMYDQLRYPASMLLNPGESPDEVILKIAKESIRVTTDDGRSLAFGLSSGASGVSQPFTPLIPSPLVGYHWSEGRFYGVTGVFLASTGHSLLPGKNLQAVLDGAPVQPSTRYEVTASASAAAGVSQSLSYGITTPLQRSRIVWAPRVVGYYRAATAEARLRAGTETNEDTLPVTADTERSFFYSYPGNGYGLGARLDFGAVLEYPRFTAGASILNVIGMDSVTGTHSDGTIEEERTITNALTGPAGTIAVAYRIPFDTGTLQIAADILASEAYAAHGEVRYVREILMLGLMGGYKSGFEGAVRLGFRHHHRRLTLSVTMHESPFVGDVVWGVGLHVGVRR